MVIICKIIVSFHNQDIDINTVKIQINYNNTRIPMLCFYNYTHFPPPSNPSLAPGSY